MKLLRGVFCLLWILFLLLNSNALGQNRSLADAFVGGASAGKPAPASTPAGHRAAVEQLFEQIDMPETVNRSVMQISAALTGAAAEDGAYKDAVDAYVRKYVSWVALKDEIVALYMKKFTEKEVMDLIAFYNTATGRKLLAETPDIGATISVTVHKRLVDHSPELKQMMMETDFKAFKVALSDDTPPEDQR